MKYLVIITVILFSKVVFGQYSTMELTFHANLNDLEIPIDSIVIKNNTQGGDTTIYYPENVLVIDYLSDINENEISITDNKIALKSYPNPSSGTINLVIQLLESSEVEITLNDIIGCQTYQYKNYLKRGKHTFSIRSDIQGYNIVNIRNHEVSKSIKVVNFASSDNCEINHISHEDNSYMKFDNVNGGFNFKTGDELQYSAYSDILEANETDNPVADKTIDFQYSAGKPCPGIPVLTDIDGNTYATVQIGEQCWMAENLKTTRYKNNTPIPNIVDDTNWENLESGSYVWYDNDDDWKDIYGALYNWYAVVDTNGLCPEGWHVPTDEEYKEMTDIVGGLDAPSGTFLKSSKQVGSPLGGESDTEIHPRWDYNDTIYGIDTFGFSGKPAGVRAKSGPYLGIGFSGVWWTSTEHFAPEHAYFRGLFYSSGIISWYGGEKRTGNSVRCIKD